MVWHVVDAQLSFLRDPAEWRGTDIVFELATADNRTEVRFTHRGLRPAFECYDNCSNAWNLLVAGNL
ncbi:MAG TPA: hypothetical protein PLK99_05105, partial [Burkholderiales bacterium]|nr:hypothetical protein [Burkholderiales bacterium]